MRNSSLAKALACLTHPLSLFAIVLLFLNDHVLRVFWPSWVTGKLGDFAWLFFMPFVVATGLALCVPASARKHERTVGLLSVGSVALVFALGNTWPATHRWLVAGLDWLLPFSVRITRDPTDLVALFSCGLALLLWRRTVVSPRRVQARALALLPVAALLTLANGGPPDYGVTCLMVEEGRVLAFTEYQKFASPDGGLTWQPYTGTLRYPCDEHAWQMVDRVRSVADPDNPQVLYRLGPEKVLAYSEDGGESWQEVSQFEFSSQAEMVSYANITPSSSLAHYARGPFDVVRDPESGNLILAMGLEGVVIQTADGAWRRVAVGGYGIQGLTAPDIVALLSGELLLAGELALLIFASLALISRRRGLETALLLCLGGGLWAFIVLGMQPALTGGYTEVLQTALIIGAAVLALGGAILGAVRLRGYGSSGQVSRMIGLAVGSALLFIVPYVLWTLDVIPRYLTSMWVALAASIALTLGGGALLLARWRDVG